jgi:hypothetical protein
MAISIPAQLDTELDALQATLQSVVDGATNTASHPVPPYIQGNRTADLLDQFVGLCDSATLTATGGSATTIVDTAAFTGVNSLLGCVVTFDAATTTAALRGTTATVIANTVNVLTFAPGDLADTPVSGDTYVVEWTAVDSQIAAMRQGKSLGDTASNPYGPGPNLIDGLVVTIEQLGGTVPSPYTVADAPIDPFGAGSPHAGAGSLGHGGGEHLVYLLEVMRDTVAGWTVPAP